MPDDLEELYAPLGGATTSPLTPSLPVPSESGPEVGGPGGEDAGVHYVAVVGPGGEASNSDCTLAREVGTRLGQAGVTVLTGGLGGVMAAAAAGARSAGADVVGLLPGASREEASDGVTVALPTGLGELRNGLIVRAADAVIAVGGSWGTLSELALARRTGVPVVCLAGWSVHDQHGAPVPLAVAGSPADAVRWVLAQLA